MFIFVYFDQKAYFKMPLSNICTSYIISGKLLISKYISFSTSTYLKMKKSHDINFLGVFVSYRNWLLRCWNSFSAKFDGTLTSPVFLKLPPRSLELWFILQSFHHPRLPFISVNTSPPCMEYYFHAWVVVHICYLDMSD